MMIIYDERGTKEVSQRMSYEEGIMEEESWERNHGRYSMGKASWRRSPRNHQQTPSRHKEAPRMHQEYPGVPGRPPGGTRRHSGGSQDAPRRHPGAPRRHPGQRRLQRPLREEK